MLRTPSTIAAQHMHNRGCLGGILVCFVCTQCTMRSPPCRSHKNHGCAAYGTYVLAATDMTCRVKELEQEVVVFNPKKEVIALVAITWAFQIISLCVPSVSLSA